jgi:hypothetical protein
VRLIGVGAAGLTETSGQMQLFDAGVAVEDGRGSGRREKRARLDAALDRIRERFGEEAIRRASMLETPEALWTPRTPDMDG